MKIKINRKFKKMKNKIKTKIKTKNMKTKNINSTISTHKYYVSGNKWPAMYSVWGGVAKA